MLFTLTCNCDMSKWKSSYNIAKSDTKTYEQWTIINYKQVYVTHTKTSNTTNITHIRIPACAARDWTYRFYNTHHSQHILDDNFSINKKQQIIHFTQWNILYRHLLLFDVGNWVDNYTKYTKFPIRISR